MNARAYSSPRRLDRLLAAKDERVLSSAAPLGGVKGSPTLAINSSLQRNKNKRVDDTRAYPNNRLLTLLSPSRQEERSNELVGSTRAWKMERFQREKERRKGEIYTKEEESGLREQRGLFNVCIRAIMTLVSSLSTVIGYYLFVFAFEAIKSSGGERLEFEHTRERGRSPLPLHEFASLPDGTMKRSFDAFEYTYPAWGILVGGVKSSTFVADEGNLNIHSLGRVMLHRSSASVQG